MVDYIEGQDGDFERGGSIASAEAGRRLNLQSQFSSELQDDIGSMEATAGQDSRFNQMAKSDGKYRSSNRGGQRNFKLKNGNNAANKTMQFADRRPLGALDEEENTYVTTNTMVKVDYIEGEYDQQTEDGFRKKQPRGYNGSSAGPPGTGRFGDGSDGNNTGKSGSKDQQPDQDSNPPKGLTLLSLMEDQGPKKPLTDEQVTKIMSEDPAAMLFLQGMLPGGNNDNADKNDESVNLNELSVVDPN